MGFFRPSEGAVLITAAQQSRQDEMRKRQRHYSYTMAFRTISFVVAVVIPIPVWAKIALIAGAIVLPWTAVTAANAGPKLQKTAEAYTPEDSEPLQLDPATVIEGDVVIPGTILDETDEPEPPATDGRYMYDPVAHEWFDEAGNTRPAHVA